MLLTVSEAAKLAVYMEVTTIMKNHQAHRINLPGE